MKIGGGRKQLSRLEAWTLVASQVGRRASAIWLGGSVMSLPHPAPNHRLQGDGCQRPLLRRSRCLPRLKRSVDMTSDVKS
jgi:hypothetical protein